MAWRWRSRSARNEARYHKGSDGRRPAGLLGPVDQARQAAAGMEDPARHTAADMDESARWTAVGMAGRWAPDGVEYRAPAGLYCACPGTVETAV